MELSEASFTMCVSFQHTRKKSY